VIFTTLKTSPSVFMTCEYGHFWTATATNDANALSRVLYEFNDGVARGNEVRGMGFSVRCVRD